ncbi:MAG: hypothetical protein PHI48_06815 [Bacteroidales bacterium]|nr:hypothetical protein [Bacteroidales bacterium]
MKINNYKSIVLLTLCISLLFACSNSDKKANEQLEIARALYESNDLNQAKLEVDNIRNFYPKAYKVIKRGNRLMRDIELKEQRRTVAYCDSTLKIKESEVAPLTEGFILEKDTAYEEVGNWVYKTQVIEKNVNRNYLRTTVNEKGKIVLSSIYRGSAPLKHSSVKIEGTSGEFAKTLTVAEDGANNYTFNDGGVYNEIVTYKNGTDNGVINFINNNQNQTLKVTFIGKRNLKTTLSKEDKIALEKSFNLAATLSDIERMKKEIKMAQAKIEFLTKKNMESDSLKKE